MYDKKKCEIINIRYSLNTLALGGDLIYIKLLLDAKYSECIAKVRAKKFQSFQKSIFTPHYRRPAHTM